VNRFLDYILTSQLTTSVAWACAVGAHLVERYANENWQFSVYVLLIVSALFMALPYIFLYNEESNNEPSDH